MAKGNETSGDLMNFKPPVAGGGSKPNPKKPDYRGASSYSPVEKVNEGPSGGKKGKVAGGGGQNDDNWAAEHNKLVGQSDFQKDPYRARGSDFSVKHVDARTGQSGEYGFSSGGNELATLSEHQEGPRHCEDNGSNTPVPGDRSRKIASSFSIETSAGEGGSETGEIGIEQYLDMQTGHIVGGEVGRVQYVPQHDVHIGKAGTVNPKAGHVGQNRKG